MNKPTLSKRLEVRERPKYRTPIMYQNWRNLLFLHWEFDADSIQTSLPEGLWVDTFEGKAYMGVVPFFIEDVHPPFLPPVPGVSDFQELNVRTYVHDKHGTPGVFFYSLDASQWLAVQAARLTFSLPYQYATMKAETNEANKEISYSCLRVGTDPSLKSEYKYRPVSESYTAKTESLEFFLVERYLLFTKSRWTQRLLKVRVYHVPYPLLDVEVDQYDHNMFIVDGLRKPGVKPDHKIMSAGVDVEIFGLEILD